MVEWPQKQIFISNPFRNSCLRPDLKIEHTYLGIDIVKGLVKKL